MLALANKGDSMLSVPKRPRPKEMNIMKKPALRIPSSSVKKFFSEGVPDGLRTGQAFHQYFKLEKHTGDKEWLDKLYEADSKEAKAMILEITDESQ